MRQRGTQMHPGDNVGVGRDHTLYARIAGTVVFGQRGPSNRRIVSILPA